ncbi:MAG: winged helix-turn-helix domain-containing protein [Parvularculaceae bacterium]
MRILLVEDDAETASYVARGLRAEGHVIDIAASGHDGLHLAVETPIDLLIVDRMLPGLDGVALVKALRSTGKKTPVLFLTALGAVADRVEGLEAGGDDYLVKPFSFSELKARVNALARRPPLQDQLTELVAGDLKLDRLKRRVTRGSAEIDLQPREFQILEFLMASAGRVVTRTMLLEAVWDFRFDPGTNIVETHISRLRAKIDRGGDPPLIRTLRGAGYVIRAD